MPQSLPYFSIIIPTRSRSRQLAECLAGLARLDYPRDRFQVIVVDDESPMQLDAVIQAASDQLEVTLMRQKHAGPAMARNRGAQSARGEFLAFTDDDCIPAPDWLRRFAESLQTSPGGMVGGHTVNALEDNPFSTASQTLIDYLYARHAIANKRARFFTTNNMALAAAPFRALGGFETTFLRAAAEDRELCDRWLGVGQRMVYVPEALVYHHHALSWRTYWRQHFWYGAGAYAFHYARARRGDGKLRIEPARFYLDLVRYPLTRFPPRRARLIILLLVVSQIANALGFFCALATRTKR